MTIVLADSHAAAALHESGHRIKNLFCAVLPHTADPDSGDFVLPPFTHVHVEVRGGELRLICTDRFTMGIVRHQLTSTSPDFAASFAVPVEDIRLALEPLDVNSATMIVEENALHIMSGDASAKLTGTQSTVPWRGTLERLLTPEPTPTGHVALDPRLLARFQEAQPLDPKQPMIFRLSGQDKAVIATLGTVFLGLVQPMNLYAASHRAPVPKRPLDVWFDLVDEGPVPAVSLAGSPS
jgi:hypothetical protein